METENGQSPACYDILIMLGGLWPLFLYYQLYNEYRLFNDMKAPYIVFAGSAQLKIPQHHGNSNQKCVAKFRKTPCFQ